MSIGFDRDIDFSWPIQDGSSAVFLSVNRFDKGLFKLYLVLLMKHSGRICSFSVF